MTKRLIKIEAHNLNMAWGEAAHYLNQALCQTPEYALIDIYNLIKDGALTLWMFYNDKKKAAFGAMTTEIIEHPQKRILSIFLMSADDFDDVEPLFQPLLAYAKTVRADSVECCGRFGLEKLLDRLGFKKSYIVMNIDVN